MKLDIDAYFFLLLSRRSTKYGGWAFAILHVILKALLVDDALKLPSVTSIYDLMHFGVLFREAPTFLFLNFAGGAYLSGTLSSFCSRR